MSGIDIKQVSPDKVDQGKIDIFISAFWKPISSISDFLKSEVILAQKVVKLCLESTKTNLKSQKIQGNPTISLNQDKI